MSFRGKTKFIRGDRMRKREKERKEEIFAVLHIQRFARTLERGAKGRLLQSPS